MRKVCKISVISILAVLFLIMCYIGYEIVHLKIFASEFTVTELNKKQKEEDFKYLTDIVQKIYPFDAGVSKVKGLDNINDLRNSYIERAKETKDNLEFIKLFIEYTDRLRQAGHGGIMFFDNFDLYQSYTMDISKDNYYKSQYWRELFSKLNLYVHGDIKISYFDGEYIIAEDCYLSEKPEVLQNQVFVPKDSKLLMVNDVSVDQFVKTLQDITPLRYDEVHKKVFTTGLFMKDPGEDKKGWKLEYQLPDGNIALGYLKKELGFIEQDPSKLYPYSNIYCSKLSESTAYMKINSFEGQYKKNDKEVIDTFMKSSKGELKKLIIDLRGNQGGEPTYWMDLLVRPLLKDTMVYKQKTAVKKGFFDKMGYRYKAYRFIYSNDLLDKNVNHITEIKKIKDDHLDAQVWEVYEITRSFTPKDRFDFEGQVYVLVDNDSISAADSFVTAVRELKIAKVVGANTYGWGNIFIAPMVYVLPNSGLMFRMDVELAYNVDDKETSIYGTAPDINLAPSMYPTSYPISYQREELLQEEWIQWCIQN